MVLQGPRVLLLPDGFTGINLCFLEKITECTENTWHIRAQTFLPGFTRALVQLTHWTRDKNEVKVPCELEQVIELVSCRTKTTVNPPW